MRGLRETMDSETSASPVGRLGVDPEVSLDDRLVGICPWQLNEWEPIGRLCVDRDAMDG